ncbi:hypothetical protein [Nostoc sp.]
MCVYIPFENSDRSEQSLMEKGTRLGDERMTGDWGLVFLLRIQHFTRQG